MSRLFVVVLLYTVVYNTDVVRGNSTEGSDDGTLDSLIGSKKILAGDVSLSKLLEKIEEQEARLRRLQEMVEEQNKDSKQKAFMIEQLQVVVASNADNLKEKDRRIDQLENELTDIKTKLRDVNLSDVSNDVKVTSKIQPDDDRIGPEENGGTNSIFTRSLAENKPKSMTITKNKITKRVGESSKTVAFSVSLSSNTNVNAHLVIKYDDILLDMGNGYNNGNGIYVVPETGIYVFTWSSTSILNTGSKTNIFVNGSARSVTFADSSPFNAGSATGLVVVSVSTGDHVYIEAMNTGEIMSVGTTSKSTFSGWRLY